MIEYPLLQGQATPAEFEILVEMTSISGANVKQALFDHFVGGMNRKMAAELNDVKLPNLTRAARRIDEVNDLAEKLALIRKQIKENNRKGDNHGNQLSQAVAP